jgi:hypothetical protein
MNSYNLTKERPRNMATEMLPYALGETACSGTGCSLC